MERKLYRVQCWNSLFYLSLLCHPGTFRSRSFIFQNILYLYVQINLFSSFPLKHCVCVCVFVYSGMYNVVNKSVRIFALFKEINVCPNPILTTQCIWFWDLSFCILFYLFILVLPDKVSLYHLVVLELTLWTRLPSNSDWPLPPKC